jgi:uncharacterized protein (TIGR02231 family)
MKANEPVRTTLRTRNRKDKFFFVRNPLFLGLCLALVLFGVIQASAYAMEKTVSSSATSVRVFLNGAQVTRSASFSLDQGTTTVVLEGLSQFINPSTIQVSGKGNFLVMDVNHQMNYLQEQEKTREIRLLEDSLSKLSGQLEFEKGMLWVSREEESLLLSNKALGGTQTGVKTSDLKEAADFFRTRLKEIKTKQLEHERKIKELDDSIQKIQAQLALQKGKRTRPTSQISVTLSAAGKTNGTLEVSYFTQGAGWTPFYDLRAKSVNDPVELLVKAQVFQNTGETWNMVRFSVSSANPVRTGQRPDLNPWYLGFFQPPSSQVMIRGMARQSKLSTEEVFMVMDDAVSLSESVVVSENQVSFEYELAVPYSLPPDGKKYTLELQTHSFPASFEYHCIPKIDTDAFLIARVTGWESQNLLPGDMQLFFEGTYVGKSILDPGSISDTLQLALGRDKGIVVKRTRLSEYTERRFLGQNRIDSRGWEISVRNNKALPVKLIVEDQIPVSTNKEIEISAQEVSGAAFNRETGKLTWTVYLSNGEGKTFRTKYSVKYPKDKTVVLD